MRNLSSRKILVLPAFLAVLGLFACGGGTMQDKMYDALKAEDARWECYEAVYKGDSLSVKIEVDYPVKFKDGNRALAVVKKIAPNAKAGMIEFTNQQTGMTLRKVPIE